MVGMEYAHEDKARDGTYSCLETHLLKRKQPTPHLFMGFTLEDIPLFGDGGIGKVWS